MIKTAIFDWDGTVMDSIDRIVSSLQQAARAADIEVPNDDKAKSIIGLSLQPAIDILFPSATPEQTEVIMEEYRQQYIAKDTTPTPLFEGLEVLLDKLLQQGWQLAVATGKSRKGLDRVFDATGLRNKFVTSRCADESKSKPDPEMLLQIMAELDLSAKQCVFIGDTVHDLQMAQAIGMPSIGVTYGVNDREALMKHQPVAVVDSVAELSNVIDYINNG